MFNVRSMLIKVSEACLPYPNLMVEPVQFDHASKGEASKITSEIIHIILYFYSYEIFVWSIKRDAKH